MILRKLKTKQMEEVAMVLLEVFADFGVPKSVQHDQDPLFMNQVLDRLRQATHWKTKAVMCYFPSQNGAVKRYVGEFKKVLYKLINGESYNWDLYVPVVQMSLNQLILPRHKSAPFSVMHPSSGWAQPSTSNLRKARFDSLGSLPKNSMQPRGITLQPRGSSLPSSMHCIAGGTLSSVSRS